MPFSAVIEKCSAGNQQGGGQESAATVKKVEGTGGTEHHELYGRLVDQRMKIEGRLTSG